MRAAPFPFILGDAVLPVSGRCGQTVWISDDGAPAIIDDREVVLDFVEVGVFFEVIGCEHISAIDLLFAVVDAVFREGGICAGTKLEADSLQLRAQLLDGDFGVSGHYHAFMFDGRALTGCVNARSRVSG